MIHNCPATSVLLFWNFPDIIVQIISRKCQGYQSSRSFSLSTSWYHYISRARGTLLLSFSIRKVYRIYLFRWSVFHDGYTVAQHSKWFWTKDNNETFHHSRPICVDLLSVHWMSHLFFFFLFSFWMLHDVVISSSWRSVRNLRSRLAHPYPAPMCHGLPFQPCIGATSTLTFSVLCYNDSRSNISWSNGSEEASSSGKATIVRVWLRAGTTPIGGKSGSVTTPEPLQPFLVLYSQFHR